MNELDGGTEIGRVDELWTPKRVAKHLGVSNVTVWRWMRDGRLAYHEIVGMKRIERKEVDRFVKAQGEKGPQD